MNHPVRTAFDLVAAAVARQLGIDRDIITPDDTITTLQGGPLDWDLLVQRLEETTGAEVPLELNELSPLSALVAAIEPRKAVA